MALFADPRDLKSRALQVGDEALRARLPAPVQGIVPGLPALGACVGKSLSTTLKCWRDTFLRNLETQAEAGDPVAKVLWDLGRQFLPARFKTDVFDLWKGKLSYQAKQGK
jgi:hypothetical protein